MNRNLSIALIVIFLVSMLACSKKTDDIPVPVEAPEQVQETAQPVQEQPKPNVDVTDEPEVINQIDPNTLNLDDITFDFDKFDLRPDAREALTRYAEVLKANPTVKVLIEGHCANRSVSTHQTYCNRTSTNEIFYHQ